MTVVLLLILVIPLSLAVGSLVGNLDSVVAHASSLATFTLPPPPDWVARIPIQGPKLSAQWQRISAEGPAGFSAMVMPYVGPVLEWLARRVGGIGAMILQFCLTVSLSPPSSTRTVKRRYGESASSHAVWAGLMATRPSSWQGTRLERGDGSRCYRARSDCYRRHRTWGRLRSRGRVTHRRCDALLYRTNRTDPGDVAGGCLEVL